MPKSSSEVVSNQASKALNRLVLPALDSVWKDEAPERRIALLETLSGLLHDEAVKAYVDLLAPAGYGESQPRLEAIADGLGLESWKSATARFDRGHALVKKARAAGGS